MAKIRALTDSGADRVRRAVLAVEGGLLNYPPGDIGGRRQWQIKLGKADTDIAAGSSGYFQWWRSTEAETGESSQTTGVWAHDWFATGFDQGDKVLLFRPLPSARNYAFKFSGNDELVRVTSDDTQADYLADKHYSLTGSTYNADWDIPVAAEVTNPGGYEQIFHFINTSQINWWSTKNAVQLLVHDSSQTGWAVPETASAAYELNEDLDITHWIMNESTGRMIFRGYIDASAIYGHSTAGEWHLGINGGLWQWLAPGGGAGTDVLVKVSADDTAADYLHNQLENQKTSTYNSLWDIDVQAEVLNDTADESVLLYVQAEEIQNIAVTIPQILSHTTSGTAWSGFRHNSTVGDTTIDLYIRHDLRDIGGGNIRFEGFIDADLITGYSSAGEYHLGITDGHWAWHTPGGGGGGTDILVKVSGNDTAADYMGDQLENLTGSTYTSVWDLRVDSEVVNEAADESIRHFINASTIYNHGTALPQFLGHTTTQVGWIGLRHNSTVGDTTVDLYIKHDIRDIGGGNLRFEGFIDASEIYSYSSNGEWHLGISDGQWQWLAPGSGGAGADIFVKVSSKDSATGYLETKFTGVSTSGGVDVYDTTGDLPVKYDVTNDSGLEKLQSFVDFSAITNYSGIVNQFLVNDSTGKTRLTRNNLDGTIADEDLEITHQVFEQVGVSYFRTFIDASDIYGFTTLSEVHLSLNNGQWQFIAPPPGGGTDEKVKVSANDTNANYLEVKLVNVSTSGGVFASGHDLTIDLDVENDSGAEQIRPFIDASALPGYSSNGEYHLGISGSTWGWYTPGGAGTDIYVKVSADDTSAGYLEDKLHNQSGTILFTSQQDYEIKWDTVHPSSAETQRGYIDASTIAGWDTSQYRTLGALTGGNKYFFGLENDLGTTYSSSGDLKFVNTVRLTSGIYRRRTFLDADQVYGHSTNGTLYLGIDDGAWQFLSPGAADVYVMVSGDDTGSTYLENQLDNHTGATPEFTSSQDIKIKFDTINPAADEQIRGYIDASTIANYDNAYEQTLIHQSSGTFAWGVADKPIWFANDNTIAINATEVTYGFDMTPGIVPSSDVHGMTLTTSDEVYFHKAGVYYIEWEALVEMPTASTEILNIHSRPEIWNGATWVIRQEWMSNIPHQIVGSTKTSTPGGGGPSIRFHGTLMTTISTGNKMRLTNLARVAHTTSDPAGTVYLRGGSAFVHRVGTT